MKTIITAALVLTMAVCPAFASGKSEIDDQKLQAFVKVFPKYIKLAEKHKKEISKEKGSKEAVNYKREVEALFKKYNVNTSQFAELVHKVTYAFSAAKMKQRGIPAAWMNDPSVVSHAEMALIEKHVGELEKILK